MPEPEVRAQVTVAEAMERLAVIPDYDSGDGPGPCVHTQRRAIGGMRMGAHWKLDKLRDYIEQHGVEEAGPMATALGYGLVVLEPRNAPLFLATKQPEKVAA